MQHLVLENCIVRLQQLRNVYHSQLDAGVLAELDDVLQQLMRLAETDEREPLPLGTLGIRALGVIETVLKLVTNVTELMR